MIYRNIKIAFRNIVRNKEFTLLNLTGLSIGIMSFLFIFLWIQDELSYDNFHHNKDSIYRIAWHNETPQTRTPHPMTYQMVEDFPEVENAVSITPVWGSGLTQPDRLVKYGETQFEENGIFAADTTFFQVFSFPLSQGDPKTCLKDVGSIIITESIAKKYFGQKDPMGKIIIINFGQDIPFLISGIMEDIPLNSHFHFDFLVSYNTLKSAWYESFFQWGDFGHYNYIVLKNGEDPKDVEAKIIPWITPHLDWSEDDLNRLKNEDIKFSLQPLKDIHLYSNLKWELEPNGDISYVYIFTALGLFIILIACINFMNLSTANATKRFLEVGIKKVHGATKLQIRSQFLIESIITALIGLILAVILFEIVAPIIGNIAQKNFMIGYDQIGTITGLLLIGLICGLLAGVFPAFLMSGFAPVNILKGSAKQPRNKSLIRNILVVLQFSISIFLIIGSLGITRQVKFLQEKKLGFDSNNMIVVPIQDTLMKQNYLTSKVEFLNNSHVLNVSAVSNIPGRSFNQNPIQWKSAEKKETSSQMQVDCDFAETIGLKIMEGRNFSKNRPSDLYNVFIINQTAASLFDWNSPLEEDLICDDDVNLREGKIIGIIEDFHFQSLHSSIAPLIIQFNPENFNYFLIRIDGSDIKNTLAYLEQKYSELDPGHPFLYFYLDDDFSKLYVAESRMQKVTIYFTILAIMISCIGLFGLSAYAAIRRTKEIGIRKVNGATTIGLIGLLTKDFTKWIVLSFFIAAPLSWYLMDNWLENFAYKVGGSVLIYIIAGVIAIIISWITIGYQSFKVARKNPVDTLRCE